MKVTRDEFIKELNELIGDNADKVHMLEDFEDTFTDNSPMIDNLTAENTKLKADYDGLMQKYRSRFLSRDEPSTTTEPEPSISEAEQITYDDLFS